MSIEQKVLKTKREMKELDMNINVVKTAAEFENMSAKELFGGMATLF